MAALRPWQCCARTPSSSVIAAHRFFELDELAKEGSLAKCSGATKFGTRPCSEATKMLWKGTKPWHSGHKIVMEMREIASIVAFCQDGYSARSCGSCVADERGCMLSRVRAHIRVGVPLQLCMCVMRHKLNMPFIPPDDDHAHIRQPSNSTICWISVICPKHNCAVNYQATSLNPSFQLTISVTQDFNYHHNPHRRQCMDRQGSSMLHLALARFYDVSCHFLLCKAV